MRWIKKIFEFWYNETRPPFMSREQIVNSIISRLTREDRNYIATCKHSNLIMLHFSFGMWIRNEYMLWYLNNPLTKDYQSGDDPRHPDNFSFGIIEDVWRQLGGQDETT